MGIVKKSDHIQSLVGEQGVSQLDETWVKLFLESENLDQLLYYLDLSLLSQRAKYKILRTLQEESIQQISAETPVVLLEDSWIKSSPYDQFLKRGSFIWAEEGLELRSPVKVFKINPSGLEAILPWIVHKIETDQNNAPVSLEETKSTVIGEPYYKFVGQAIIVLSIFIALNFFVQSNSIKLANSGVKLESTQIYGLYALLIFGALIVSFFPFQSFSWNQINALVGGFMKRFKLDRFERKKRTIDSFNTLTSLMDLVSPEKALIPLTAFLSLVVSMSFLYDTIIGVCAVLIFGLIYYLQHLALESKARSQLATTLSAQSVFLDAYRGLTLFSTTARRNSFMGALRNYWQSLSESYASAIHAKDKANLWYQARLALIRTVLVQFVFLIMVLVLGLGFVDYVSFSAIQMALTVITGPTHDLFKRLKDYTNFSVLSGQFTFKHSIKTVETPQEMKLEKVRLLGTSSPEVNFTFNSSVIYSIVGKSGSGKSALAKILTSMNTFADGVLHINDETILPNEAWRLKSIFINEGLPWRGGRIIDFLTAEDSNPDVKRLRTITEDLGIDQKIMLLKDGYETEVEEVNLPFSHAEEMFLSLTRAVYANYSAIVLDNVLNRADSTFQKRVFTFLRKHANNRMIFLIDNDFEIIRASDYTLVVDQGNIADHGPSEELIVISDKLKRVSRPTRYFL